MGIYPCNKCGHLQELAHSSQSQGVVLGEADCPKCGVSNKIYDTVFYIQKLLERYFSINRELAAFKVQEDQESEQVDVDDEDMNLLTGVKLSSTNILANAEQHAMLAQWFQQVGVQPIFDYSAVDMSGYFDEAAEQLGSKYQLTKDLLGRISWAYRHQHTSISIDISKMSQKDGQVINTLSRQFYSHTLFSKYIYQKKEKVIRLHLQSAAKIRSFFIGAWLEWFALGQVLGYAKKRGGKYAFSCARGVKIQFSNEDKHELDVVFMPKGKQPLIVECKTGEFRKDIEKYIRLKKRLGLSNDNFVILALDLTSEQAAALNSMYEITFVTLDTLMPHLQRVL